MCEQCEALAAEVKAKMVEEGVLIRIFDPETVTPVVSLYESGAIVFDTEDPDTLRRALALLAEEAQEAADAVRRDTVRRHYLDTLVGALIGKLPADATPARVSDDPGTLSANVWNSKGKA